MKILERIIRRQVRKEIEPLERKIEALQHKVNAQGQPQAQGKSLYEQFVDIERQVFEGIQEHGLSDITLGESFRNICIAINKLQLLKK